MKAYFRKRDLIFKFPAGTSRGFLYSKPSWFIFIYNEDNPQIEGVGECSVIPGLSLDDEAKMDDKLTEICHKINQGENVFNKQVYEFPSISFGLEMALKDLEASGSKILFPTTFAKGEKGIEINGLIWMGEVNWMIDQIKKKLDEGFTCIKIKIGALNLDKEFRIIKNLRKNFAATELEIRVDANGAFGFEEAGEILNRLAELDIHSIEQPIVPSQLTEMAKLCETSPVPIALDEELIGKYTFENKKKLVEILKPQYLVLKPSLLGGFSEASDWIKIAGSLSIDWWITSALESNIGLSAIAQRASTFKLGMPQGLGTGSLYKENIASPLEIRGAALFYNSNKRWHYEFIS